VTALRLAVLVALVGPRVPARPGAAVLTRRRSWVFAGVTLAAGMALLGVSLRVQPGDPLFLLLTTLTAAVWVVGGRLTGPAPGWGRERPPERRTGAAPGGTAGPRPGPDERGAQPPGGVRIGLTTRIVGPLVIGLALAAVFVAGALVVRQVPALNAAVDHVLAHADGAALVPAVLAAVLNGVAEEVYFRGGLYAVLTAHRPVLTSTVVYVVATAATGNPMLVFASATVGAVLAVERRATGGILAPVLTHVTWSTLMLFVLPPLFGP
jgi:hypothetical protein